jgi:hypothetical protein
MPCALCGDIIPTEVARCPACGAWARRRDFRAVGVAVFMLLGFNAFVALGSGISMVRLSDPLRHATLDTFDPDGTGRMLSPYADVFVLGAVMAGVTGLLYVGWLWRAYQQSPGPHRYGKGWVLLGWLAPPANLWIPPRIVFDVWATSGRLRTSQRHLAWTVVAAWWASVLLGIGLARMFATSDIHTLADARFSVHLGVAAAACQALAAALCMATVFEITRIQIGKDA